MSQWGVPGTGVGHFTSPSGIALDGNGNVFVTETGVTNRVQQFDSTGTPLNMWGTAGGGSFEFARPTSIVVTGAGTVFVADEFNGRVQQFTLQARPPLPPPVSLGSFPLGSPLVNRTATVDPSGNTFEFTDTVSGNVATCALTKYSPTGQQLWQQATAGRDDGQFCGDALNGRVEGIPASLATDRNGDVYVKEGFLQRIQVFGPTGTFLRSWQSPHFLENVSQSNFRDGPMTIAPNDHLWVYDVEFNEMQESTLTGTPLTSWAVPDTVFNDIHTALAFDPVLGHLVLGVNDTLLTLTTAGAAVAAPLGLPNAPFGSTVSIKGIAADAAGHIVVAANFFSTLLNTALPSRLDVLDGAGNLLTAVNPVLGVPDIDDTSVDRAGKLYVLADKFGRPQIQIFGPIVPAALLPPLFVKGFGVISTDGGFQAPQALSTAADGDVYVSTVGTFGPHSRVYRFTADGVFQNVFDGDCALTGTGLCPPPAPGLFASFSGAYQTADDGKGTVYVTDHWNGRIQEFSPSGTYLGQFPTGPDPLALGIDGTGNLDAILVDLDPTHTFVQRQIEQYTPAGAVVRRWGPSLATVQWVQPNMNWLAIDPQGNIVALIHENDEGKPIVGSVQRFSPAGAAGDLATGRSCRGNCSGSPRQRVHVLRGGEHDRRLRRARTPTRVVGQPALRRSDRQHGRSRHRAQRAGLCHRSRRRGDPDVRRPRLRAAVAGGGGSSRAGSRLISVDGVDARRTERASALLPRDGAFHIHRSVRRSARRLHLHRGIPARSVTGSLTTNPTTTPLHHPTRTHARPS